MHKQIEKVKEWRTKFEVPAQEIKNADYLEIVRLRYKLMAEENKEYLEAAVNEDRVEIADALGDMLYILLGTVLEHGMGEVITEVFEEIHRSNMSKLGVDGKPVIRCDGKIIKGPYYFRPNLTKIIPANEFPKLDKELSERLLEISRKRNYDEAEQELLKKCVLLHEDLEK